ncbi:Endonuclease [Flavobacterium sp. 9AF]|uniref:endonuclease/exonuclease/phosphatase family protein n=1 Tax=Flavobacterium sp. 9AF TaxID=2653142 RepID=UPI0012F2AEAD|nr:endonuclease/exonuclease/phosphatase family protein [Flavobacterium sp. 9AF]VXB07802.1 Endonuclease [Flavobacterium sp. 9AF]
MKLKCIVLALFYSLFSWSQIKICSWNIENLGGSKSEKDISYMAQIVKDYDIVALQEVIVSDAGAQAVALLVETLNRKGNHWDYAISNPTSGNAYKAERYAFLWKPNKVKKIGDPFLEATYVEEIEREPFLGTFTYEGKEITLVNFHAKTKKLQPETEIKYFKFFPNLYPNKNLVFIGDFNCPQSHTVFFPLRKMGYESVFVNQKTSLRQKCIQNDCLASEYDNIFFNTKKFEVIDKGIIPFYLDFPEIQEARNISDHVPIWVILK